MKGRVDMPTKNKLHLFIFASLSIIGFCSIIGAFALYNSYNNFKNIAIETEATITRIAVSVTGDDTKNVYVSFFANGIEYSGKLDYHSPGMREGGKTKVLYHHNNPQNFRSAHGDIFGVIILSIMGLSFFLIGFSPLLNQVKKDKLKQILMLRGKKVLASIDDIVDGNIAINYRACRNIICSYKDGLTNNIYVFRSENIWTKLPRLDDNTQLPPIEVYVDSSDFSKYYVDVDNWLNVLSRSTNMIDFT